MTIRRYHYQLVHNIYALLQNTCLFFTPTIEQYQLFSEQSVARFCDKRLKHTE